MELRKLKSALNNLIWQIRYRLDPRHRYHVINLRDQWGRRNGMDYGWEEVDTRMMHACFRLLVDYVEKQKPFDILSFDEDDSTRSLKKDILDLYGWWTVTRAKEHAKLAEAWDKVPPYDFGQGSWKPRPEAKEALALQKELDDKDDEMLMKLVTIRRSLWT